MAEQTTTAQPGAVPFPAPLAAALKQGNFPHAVLLEGAAGSGKTALAKLLAKAAVCTGTGEKPCGHCSNCMKAAAGSHPDITIEGGGTAARSFHVETVRRIRTDAYIQPNEAPRRVFVLLHAETMSEQAQNALLKVLEEPPQTAVFILTATAASSLLPTVRSRTQLFSLEGAAAADPLDLQHTAEIAAALPASDNALLNASAPFIKDKEGFRRMLKQLSLLLRDASVLRAGGTACISGQQETAAVLSKLYTRRALLQLWEITRKVQSALERNANTTLLVTAFCAQMRSVNP